MKHVKIDKIAINKVKNNFLKNSKPLLILLFASYFIFLNFLIYLSVTIAVFAYNYNPSDNNIVQLNTILYTMCVFSPMIAVYVLFLVVSYLRKIKENVFLKNYDKITKLPNNEFFKQYSKELSDVYSSAHIATILVEISNSKTIVFKDEFEYANYNYLIGERIKKSSKLINMCAKINTDCFGIIYAPVYSTQMVEDEAEKLIDIFNESWEINDKKYLLNVSIGINYNPDSIDNNTDAYGKSYIALYFSRDIAKNSYSFYSPYMKNIFDHKNDSVPNLRMAIENREMMLYYQPKISCTTGEIIELEALLRWYHPQNGFISPSEFIPIAEEEGIILTLGEWIFKECNRQFISWRQKGLRPIKVTLNISDVQFNRPNFSKTLSKFLSQEGIDTHNMGIAINEMNFDKDFDEINQEILHLKKEGFEIELNNFGVAYGSINIISHLPLDYVKIDKSFVSGIGKEKFSENIIKLLVELCHSKSIKVIGSGIETPEQLHFLKSLNCDLLEGFLICKPLHAEDIESYLIQGKILDFTNDV